MEVLINTTTHIIAQLKWSFLMLKIVHILIIECDDNGPKFEAGDHVRISKYKSILCKRFHSKLL